MTTATLRFTLDLAISKATQPHHKLMFQPGIERPRGCTDIPVHDAEIPEPEIIEIWGPTELDLDEWPYYEPEPKPTSKPGERKPFPVQSATRETVWI